jgi:ABC-type transport system involved in cytochrome c biogenesis permease subunit
MSDAIGGAGAKTPWHLWVVGVVSLLWNSFGCFDFTMTATRNAAYLEPYPPEMLDYWFAMPMWIWALWVIGVFGGFAGSVMLLLRRKLAFSLFSASFLAAAISMLVGTLDQNAPRMEGAGVMSFVIVVIAALFVAYAWWMSRRDVLR